MANTENDPDFPSVKFNYEQVKVLVQHLTETQSTLQALTASQADADTLTHNLATALLDQAHEVLQQSNELLEKIFSSIHNCIAYMDRDFNFIRVNRAYARMDDRDPEFYNGKNHFVLYPNPENQVIFQKVIDSAEPYYTFERPFTYAEHPERGLTYWDWSLLPIHDTSGAVGGLLLNLINVTDRVNAQKALRTSQEVSQRLFESAPDANILTDVEGRIVEVNHQAEVQFGYTREELIGSQIETLIPERFRSRHIEHRAVYAQNPRTRSMGIGLSLYGRKKTGEEFPVDVKLTPLQTDNDIKFLSVVRDITIRQQAERALHEKSEFVLLLQDIAIASNEAKSTGNTLQYALDRVCLLTGWPVGHAYLISPDGSSMQSAHIWHLDDPETCLAFREESDRSVFEAGVGIPGRVMQTGVPVWREDVLTDRAFTRSQTAHSAGLRAAFAFPVLVGKETVGVLEFFSTRTEEPNNALMDVMRHIGTQLGRVIERQNNRQRLEKQDALLRTVLDTLPVGVWITDETGKIVSGNPEGIRIWNGVKMLSPHQFGEYKGWWLGTGEQIKPDEWALSRAISRGESSVDELIEIEAFDGTRRIVYNSALPLLDANQHVIGAIAVNQDITDRRRLEVELAEVQRRLFSSIENERSRLAQDLHDGPIQDLYGISFQLQALHGEITKDENTAILNRTQEMLQKVITSLRTTMGELKPPSLSHFGLEKAIRSHAEKFQEQNPDIHVHLNLDPDNNKLSEQERLVLYRNYQHLTSNIIRHARARNMWVRLTIEPKQVIVEIQDDGDGFTIPKGWIDLARKGHLGLAGASERAESLGGRLEIESRPGEGALIRTVIPRKTVND